MIIIGEKLNSSIPKTLEAIKNHDTDYILDLIKSQVDCGATYLDVNTAVTLDHEIDNMFWIIDLILKNTDCGIMIDSPNVEVILTCLNKIAEINTSTKIIVNSISLTNYNENLLKAIKKYNAGVVCLPIENNNIPQTAQERLTNSEKLINILKSYGINNDQIFIDILIESIATNSYAAKTALELIELLKNNYSDINIVAGLSNISFGLPKRALLNTSFLTMAIEKGLNSVIADITSNSIRNALVVTSTLLGKDEFCIEYINKFR